MERVKCAGALAALLLLSGTALAADPAPPSAATPAPAGSLAELERRALERNPDVRAAREALAAVRARRRVDTAFEDPSLALSYMPTAVDDTQPLKWGVMLSQPVPLFGKRSKIGAVNDAEQEIARLEVERAGRDAVLKVRESWYELGYLARARVIAGTTRDLLGRFRAAGETAYARDAAALNDLARAQAQESQVGYDLVLLGELEAAERARLAAVVDDATGAALCPAERPACVTDDAGIPGVAGGSAEAGPEEAVAAALAARSELLIARAEARRAAAERALARAEGRPEFMLSLGYEYTTAEEGAEPMEGATVGLGLTLPLWSGKNAGRRAAAGAGQAKADAMVAAAENETRAEVREAWFRLGNAERLTELYRDRLLPEAARAVEVAEAAFRTGQGTLAAAVETTAAGYNFQLALARAHADRGRFASRLAALTGGAAPGGAAVAAPAGGREAEAAAWTAAVAKLDEAQRLAAAASASPGQDEVFLALPPALLAELQPAAVDGSRAVQLVAGPLPLASLEGLALLRSPAVAAAEKSLRAALEAYDQVAYLEDGIRRYAAYSSSLMTVAGGMAEGGAPAMASPSPGILALKGAIVDAGVRAAREEREIARRDAVTAVRRIAWVLDALRETGVLLERAGGLLQSLEETARARYQSGKGGLPEIVQAQVEREKLRVEEANLREERSALQAQLGALLDLPPETPFGEIVLADPAPEFPAPPALVPVALARRQELRRMRAMAARMELMLRMGQRDALPDYSQGSSWFADKPLRQAGTMRMEEPFVPAGADAAAPAAPADSWPGRDRSYLRETRERLDALLREIAAEERATEAEVREAWTALERARRERELYGTRIEELTRLAADVLERGYRSGGGTLGELLDAQRARLDAGIEAARRRAGVGAAVAALEALLGTTRWREAIAAAPAPTTTP